MRIIVTGGRDFDEYDRVLKAFIPYVFEHPIPTIVHGDARGADTLAKHAARTLGLPVEAHKAEWRELGPIAGFVRNQRMIDTKPDLLIAFPGGRGTRHCIRQAIKAGIEVIHA